MLIKRFDEKFYPGVADNWDDELFRKIILSELRPELIVLDLGAGAGIVPQMNFKGHARKVCGIDPDNRVVDNPYLDEGKVAMAETIPYPDATFDLVFSDNVLEHLVNPEEVFAEVGRVLKPQGKFLVKTPNKKHYVPLVARITPHSFHRFFNRLRGREYEDTFPTMYRANSRRDLQRLTKSCNLVIDEVRLVESRPEYLRISAVTYIFGYIYERLVNRFQSLARYRVLLVGVISKPPTGNSPPA